ncbi:hypothetical protein [Streptomyces europaeiscabiei]|uniref:hypothetical protein n=1 Tax=Streptomyces europaeiscabiei TaxID=146819 RepID=UPI002E157FAD|nr:hypothetical protein OHB30_43680 [Streptomyces europaeiscabiei]
MEWPTRALPERVEQGRLHHEAGHDLSFASDSSGAPGSGENIDDNPAVPYWNTSRKTAESCMFKAAGGN